MRFSTMHPTNFMRVIMCSEGYRMDWEQFCVSGNDQSVWGVTYSGGCSSNMRGCFSFPRCGMCEHTIAPNNEEIAIFPFPWAAEESKESEQHLPRKKIISRNRNN